MSNPINFNFNSLRLAWKARELTLGHIISILTYLTFCPKIILDIQSIILAIFRFRHPLQHGLLIHHPHSYADGQDEDVDNAIQENLSIIFNFVLSYFFLIPFHASLNDVLILRS